MPENGTAADHLRDALRGVLTAADDVALTRLRGELYVVEAMARQRRLGDDVATKVRAALESAADLQTLASELRGNAGSKRYSEIASLLDIGAIGLLAGQDYLAAERISLFRLLMGGLSEALVYASSRQYVSGSNEVLAGLYRSHRVGLDDDLWSLALELRGPDLSETVAREILGGIDAFFAPIDAPGVTVETKVSFLVQVRTLVLVLRCLSVLEVIAGFPPTEPS